ncbi:aromatic-ring-hydroxylating dioxygenase subunit beta [Novosphingobium sp.]|uniref:aromatic-ring-hydroxylating dioxygenase subunit beta n=1 Tax=Novosphingobium sp. TaxID=1874826 RepID=UPI002B492A41|nr:aromatic-ring-hydroxylating dioxygenase subunit beta [Novosphingobium sp.]HKR93062.1 aromatic-ring-hydroxylating dioxygenase subunit beta [Novosphingobium sp.]
MPLLDSQAQSKLTALIENDGRYLDQRKWDEWLDLFAEDSIFWVPTWRNENELTEDPSREVSLIYYEGRRRLQERIWRVRSGNSISSAPLVRTMHAISHVLIVATDEGAATGSANWSVHVFDPRSRTQHTFFGFYEYAFVFSGDRWLIAKKKIKILNDHIPTLVDFYTL